MESDRVKGEFAKLEEQIQTVNATPLNYDNEVARRRLWRDLELIKMKLDDNSLRLAPADQQEMKDKYPAMAKMLSLKPFAKPSGGLRGAVAFGAFFFMTTMMFPVFLATFPLRWVHPLLRKLGVRNSKLPYDYLPRIWAKLAMIIFGIQAKLEGLGNAKHFAETGTSTIGMFEHSSFFDFIVVMGSCPIFFKWVSKKSLYKIPMLGLMAYMSGMIPIDRTNLTSAKKSLDHATYVAQYYGRAIAIAPEGTRSLNGQLAEFKKGAFHLALNCKVPTTPLVLFGAYHLWPPNTICPSPGTITLRLLPPISSSPYEQELDYNRMLKDVRTAMLNAMAAPPTSITQPTSIIYSILSGITVAATYTLTAAIGWGVWKIFH
jgi:1-acyl-sn-glycerol-3-phosphate acyltransferase